MVLHHLGLRPMCVYNLRIWCRILLFVFGHFWIPLGGQKESKIFQKGHCPKIIVSNHISNMEILHLLTLPFQDSDGNPILPVFVTKATIFDLPVIGTITRDVLGSIGVSRKKKETSKEQTTHDSSKTSNNNTSTTSSTGGNPMGCTEQIVARVNNDRAGTSSVGYGPIVIFPEGTTTNGTCLLAFKKGAFVPKVPVVPVIYKFGANANDPQGSDFLPTYESIWGPAYLWRLLSQLYHPFECQFLERVSPQKEETADDFAKRSRSYMAAVSSLPMLSEEYNYAHKLKYHGGLRKAFVEHPRGAKHAMCFAPMQRVLSENDKQGPVGYDVVTGTIFVDAETKTNYGSITNW